MVLGKNRWVVMALLGVNVMLLPLTCMPIFVLMHTSLGFIGTIPVENRTGAPIAITPLVWSHNYAGLRDHCVPMMLHTQRLPAFLAARRGDLTVAPGEEIPIIYDNDDFELAFIVIEDAAKNRYELAVTQADRISGKIIIENLADLPPLSPLLVPGFECAKIPLNLPPQNPLLLLLFFTLNWLVKRHRQLRESRSSQEGT